MIKIFMFVSIFGSSQNLPKYLSKSEREFVYNVIQVQNEKVIDITKKDKDILIEFETTKIVLKQNGYIGEIWIQDAGQWISVGTEEDAY